MKLALPGVKIMQRRLYTAVTLINIVPVDCCRAVVFAKASRRSCDIARLTAFVGCAPIRAFMKHNNCS